MRCDNVPKWWMIKNDDDIITKWFENNIVSIDFSEIGNPKDYDTKDKLLMRCDEVYKNQAPIFRIRIESELWKFSREIAIGDKIITYSNKDQVYYLATVKNGYVFLPEISKCSPNIIKVEWSNKPVPQANITEDIKNSLNSPSNVYQIINNEWEIEKIFNDTVSSDGEKIKASSIIELMNEIYANCEKTIKNLQSNEILKIVDEIFRINGYIFTAMEENEIMYSIDMIYMDPFKMMKFASRITIIKGNKKLNSGDIESVIKNNNEDYKLTVISVGGFEVSAKNNVEIVKSCHFMDGRDLVKLIFKEYDKFSEGLQHVLNLRKVYI
jgi:restriction system protein